MQIQQDIEGETLMTNDFHEADLRRKRRRKICMILIFVLGTLVVLGVLFTILGFTFFKPKMPETTVNNVALQGAHTDFMKLQFAINLTLSIDLSIKNPNRVGFKYDQSVAYLRYKDQAIGEAPIEGGEIGKKETKNMNFTMTLMADKLLLDLDTYSHARSLPLSTYVVMTGNIQFLFKVDVNTNSTCDFNIDALGGALSNLSCRYETKFD